MLDHFFLQASSPKLYVLVVVFIIRPSVLKIPATFFSSSLVENPGSGTNFLLELSLDFFSNKEIDIVQI